ncbi:MAG: alpha/beta hydrolase [Candidatus Competibacteraceae bacterium]|nr:alpha/beta hydrolase [Candidatus Competibacteraceae bacterium]
MRNYTKVGGYFIAHANKDFGMAKSLIQEATPRAEVRQFIENDPGVRLDLTARELMSCQFYMYKTRRFARAIKEDPVLIVQGLKDGESKPLGAERVYKSLATKDKKFIEVADGDHYVYEDKQVNDKVFADTVSWLVEHGGSTM